MVRVVIYHKLSLEELIAWPTVSIRLNIWEPLSLLWENNAIKSFAWLAYFVSENETACKDTCQPVYSSRSSVIHAMSSSICSLRSSMSVFSRSTSCLSRSKLTINSTCLMFAYSLPVHQGTTRAWHSEQISSSKIMTSGIGGCAVQVVYCLFVCTPLLCRVAVEDL